MSATWTMLERAARRKEGVSDEWELYAAECLPHRGPTVVYKVGIGVCRRLSRGPNKGRRKWDGARTEQYISPAEVEEEAARYEAETGKCCECLGEGKTVASAGISGTTYRECHVCKGTGEARP